MRTCCVPDRLWTSGYDVYTPHEHVVFHDYTHALPLLPSRVTRQDAMGRPIGPSARMRDAPEQAMEWGRKGGRSAAFRRALFEQASARLDTLLHSAANSHALMSAQEAAALTRYGLGTKRSLQQLQEFTGIDLRTRTIAQDR